MSFPDFMQKQIEEIDRAMTAGEVGDPMEWIEKHAEAFRASHPVDETSQA